VWEYLKNNNLPPLNERRVGWFYLDPQRFYGIHGWELLTDIMGTMLPIRVEYRFDSQTFEFYCICESFEPVPLGAMVPEYLLVLEYQEAKEISESGTPRYYQKIIDWRFHKR
jgi:hypothetical protein